MRLASLALPGLLVFGQGCENLAAYSLLGQRYDEAQDCLAESQVIDVVEGSAQGTCEGVRCIQSQETGDFFVTPNCEVPELYLDLSDDETSPCPDALAAYERGDAGLCAATE